MRFSYGLSGHDAPKRTLYPFGRRHSSGTHLSYVEHQLADHTRARPECTPVLRYVIRVSYDIPSEASGSFRPSLCLMGRGTEEAHGGTLTDELC